MSHVFHRSPGASYPVAVGGDGSWLIDKNGKRYLDAAGGAAVSCLGHSDKRVVEAIKAQLDKLPFAISSFFTTDACEELADRLIADGPPGMSHVWYAVDGSEAIESALKLARQYFVEIGQPQRHHVIARRMSYHGNTIAALSTGYNPGRRALYEPLLLDSHHIDPCYEYRGKQEGESTADYGQRMANQLEAKILELGADSVMAFVAEPVVGATLGCVPAVEGYFKRIRQICDKYGVLLILDEVMCGLGRTGVLHACTGGGVVPDLLVDAKGLGAGYQPLGTVMIIKKVADAVMNGSGAFVHGHTFQGHAAACAGALAVQKIFEEDGLVQRSAEMGALLRARLESRFGNHPHVGDIRGKGLFQGVELVADRMTKTPFDPKHKVHLKVKAGGMERGLAVYPMGGTLDGFRGDHIVIAPPFIIQESEIDYLVDRLAATIDAAIPA